MASSPPNEPPDAGATVKEDHHTTVTWKDPIARWLLKEPK
jgi:hypothetical protein